jgi:hypothetical protein
LLLRGKVKAKDAIEVAKEKEPRKHGISASLAVEQKT